MCVREEPQMSADTESAAHTRMEGPSRSSQKYLLLHVWCGLLTVSLVLMAAFVASNKSKSEETSVSALKPEDISPQVSDPFSHERLSGMSSSYIELETSWVDSNHVPDHEWTARITCASCSLYLHQDSIYMNSSSPARSHFFIYAQVVFSKPEKGDRSVKLVRNPSPGRKEKVEAEVTAGARSVWLGRIVTLTGGDSVSLNISGKYQRDETFWGAFQLR
ncbi:lymphotoxin-alpha [Fundulus heteroclitus]|uniref:lymphotoxin-alpha n=1 Tax=Fundulus heteroclitus TaxID=8078 RepID=UPI00165B421D|nr:lymphotoxin-alpha [Fundulus heteroclitus]